MKKLLALFATLLLALVPAASASAASDGDELVPVEQLVKPDDGKAVKPQSYRKADKAKKAKKAKKVKKAKKAVKASKSGKKPVRKHK